MFKFFTKMPPVSELTHKGMAILTALSMLLTVTSVFLFMLERNRQIRTQIMANTLRSERAYFFKEILFALQDPQICTANYLNQNNNIIYDASLNPLFADETTNTNPLLKNSSLFRFKRIDYLPESDIRSYSAYLVTKKNNTSGNTEYLNQRVEYKKMDVKVTLYIPDGILSLKRSISSQYTQTMSLYLVNNYLGNTKTSFSCFAMPNNTDTDSILEKSCTDSGGVYEKDSTSTRGICVIPNVKVPTGSSNPVLSPNVPTIRSISTLPFSSLGIAKKSSSNIENNNSGALCAQDWYNTKVQKLGITSFCSIPHFTGCSINKDVTTGQSLASLLDVASKTPTIFADLQTISPNTVTKYTFVHTCNQYLASAGALNAGALGGSLGGAMAAYLTTSLLGVMGLMVGLIIGAAFAILAVACDETTITVDSQCYSNEAYCATGAGKVSYDIDCYERSANGLIIFGCHTDRIGGLPNNNSSISGGCNYVPAVIP